MFDFFRIFPPALQVGVILYAAVCYVWLQPLVEGRLAEKLLIPKCIAHQDAKERSEPARPDKTDPGSILDIIIPELPEEYRRTFGDIVERTKRMHDDLRPARPQIRAATACGVAVASELDKANIPMFFHVMSMRAFTPRAVTALHEGTVIPFPK